MAVARAKRFEGARACEGLCIEQGILVCSQPGSSRAIRAARLPKHEKKADETHLRRRKLAQRKVGRGDGCFFAQSKQGANRDRRRAGVRYCRRGRVPAPSAD